jgi:CxxC motif-containing protein (DUF1111 family)
MFPRTKYVFIVLLCFVAGAVAWATAVTEAPAAFDSQSNGLTSNGQFKQDMKAFAEAEENDDGVGPTYNARSCAECHENPVVGAISQVTEQRAGSLQLGAFVDAPGGSLIHSRAIDAAVQERMTDDLTVRSLRTSLNTLGDGFVEAIADTTLQNIAAAQPLSMRGEYFTVPVLEAGNAPRIGRFGWKNQHASLVSFSADAYLNEMGITSPLQPTENTSMGNSIAAFDEVADPEDNGDDVEAFARFMRATKAPPRDADVAATADAIAGEATFNSIGCATCHTSTIMTAPTGTVVNGGTFTIPAALGDKIIHPFGDFLMHDVGTGDGVVQNGPASTRNKVRTAPLWGVRTRNRLMHDGASLTFTDAIQRHQGQAAGVTASFNALTPAQKAQLIRFLESL